MEEKTNKVKVAREARGITLKEMGKKLGLSESYYCQLENGKRRMSLENALKIAAILKKNPNSLFSAKDFADREVRSKQLKTGTE